jgi:hypothetical protein
MSSNDMDIVPVFTEVLACKKYNSKIIDPRFD